MNEIKITGEFSVAEVHSWVHFCLPDVSDRIVSMEATNCYRNSFTGTHLMCAYRYFHLILELLIFLRKDEAIFKSESLTTLSVLKQFITKEATSRNIKININICKPQKFPA